MPPVVQNAQASTTRDDAEGIVRVRPRRRPCRAAAVFGDLVHGRPQPGRGDEQDAEFHHPGRVQGLLGRRERITKQRRALAPIPGHVVAADRVVVGDRAAAGDQRLRGALLDVPPGLQQPVRAAERMEGEIRCRTVRVDVGEPAGDDAVRPVASRIAWQAAVTTRSWNRSKRSQVIAVSKVSQMIPAGTWISRA